MHGISRAGYDSYVIVIKEREAEVRNPFLRADKRQDLGPGVEVNVKLCLIPIGYRLFEGLLDVSRRSRIAVVYDMLGLLA